LNIWVREGLADLVERAETPEKSDPKNDAELA